MAVVWLVLAVCWLAGCQVEPGATATAVAVHTITTAPSATPSPVVISDTATMTAAETSVTIEVSSTPLPTTPAPSPTPEPTTARPTNTPRPTATDTATPLPMLFTAAVIPGLPEETTIYDTWVDADGRFWVATGSGVFVSETPNWRQVDDEAAYRIFGVDAAGRLWVGREESAAYYLLAENEAQWQSFGAEAGWRPGLQAASVPPDFGYSETLVTDRLGRVWLVRNGELYQFDPENGRWASYVAADLGFVSAIGNDDSQSRFLTDVALDSFGNLWVSHCANQGLLFTGEGVRWYNGETWASTLLFADECILDIEMDSDGRVWLAGWRTILQFDPTNVRWTTIHLPPWLNPLMVIDLTLDSHDNPWLAVIKATGGNWQGSGARYHWTEEGWQSDYAEYEAIYGVESFSGPYGGWGSDVAFAADGDTWVCDWGTVYAFSPAHNGLFSEATSFYPEGVCQIQVDGYGRVWLAQIGRGFELWYYDPE